MSCLKRAAHFVGCFEPLMAFVPMWALATLGCASSDFEQRSALDPTNPRAPESLPLVLPSPSNSVSFELAAQTERAREAGAERYTCRMHPEITRDQPGSCPKCAMSLVTTSDK